MIEDSNYFDSPKFFARVLSGIRAILAKELTERYARNPAEDRAILAKLASPSEPKDADLFSLIQALAADVILPSAIEAKKAKGQVR